MIPRTAPGTLGVTTIGPGYGESVVIQLPDGDVAVLDSCKGADETSVAEFLRSSRIPHPEFVALTHPHGDHVVGMEQFVTGTQVPARIGCSDPVADSSSVYHGTDAKQRLRSKEARLALDAIEAVWEAPSRKQVLAQGVDVTFAHGVELQFLYPDATAAARACTKRSEQNRLSSVALLCWGSTRILLAADAEAWDWNRITATLDHVACKVPHHGSSGALHARVSQGTRDRTWVVTPWRSNSDVLPRYDDGEGVELTLQAVDELHVTSAPHEAFDDTSAPRASIRDRVIAGVVPGTTIPMRHRRPVGHLEHAWVHVEFDDAGNRTALTRGPRACTVTP